MSTAFPVTSRPAKSAAVPVPTQITSRSMPGAGVGGELSDGFTDLNVYDLPPAVVNLYSQSVGNHCVGSVNGCRWTSCRLYFRNFASTQSCIIASYFEPAIRPQYLLPSSRLFSEIATTSLS